jgi:hypothetical protein
MPADGATLLCFTVRCQPSPQELYTVHEPWISAHGFTCDKLMLLLIVNIIVSNRNARH